MGRLFRILITLVLITAFIPATTTHAQEPELPPGCQVIPIMDGDILVTTYLICVPVDPTPWNGDLIVYAHGYVSPFIPAGQIPIDQLFLPDGTPIPALITGLGYVFATTSYPVNGLAITEGVLDILNLVQFTKFQLAEIYGPVQHTYLTGVSEGALITTKAIEGFPEEFSGGMALCGPIGDFQKQINYLGDFRIVFDYFFPKVLPKSPVDIPMDLIENWDGIYQNEVLTAIEDISKTQQLIAVTQAPVDPANLVASIGETVTRVLWYNVFATNDATAKFGGYIYDNTSRVYSGSKNDKKLNRKVGRYEADDGALANLEATYQTSGDLNIPLVTMHTTLDPVVPVWHEALYSEKVVAQGKTMFHVDIPVPRYGHCAFEQNEILTGLSTLIYMAAGMP